MKTKIHLFLATALVFGFSISFSFGQPGGSTTDKQTTTTTTGDNKPSTKKEEINPNWTKWDNGQYAMAFPSEWQLDDNGTMGTSFIVFSPSEGALDLFQENINLVVQDLSTYNISVTLDEYIEFSIEQLPTIFQDFQLISSKKYSRNGYDYYEVIYTGLQSGYNLQWKQYIWLIGSEARILTFTAQEKKFALYDLLSSSIMDTFRFK